MSDATSIYISVQDGDRRLIVDGPLDLWRELLDNLAQTPTERPSVRADDCAPRDHGQAGGAR